MERSGAQFHKISTKSVIWLLILTVIGPKLHGTSSGSVESGCACKYRPGGCVISKAPDPGHTCHCVYKFIFRCIGLNNRCVDTSANCLSGCTNESCCRAGGGDCGGYKGFQKFRII